MKALTVWQPWASLIVGGAKPYEFRGWRAPGWIIGERIVIHAAARKISRDETGELFNVLSMRDHSDMWRLRAAQTCLIPDRAISVLNQALQEGLPMACGLGTAIIGKPVIGTAVAEQFGVPRANDSDRDEHANWGWPMLEIERCPEPVPMKGAQGFWTWPTPETMELLLGAGT